MNTVIDNYVYISNLLPIHYLHLSILDVFRCQPLSTLMISHNFTRVIEKNIVQYLIFLFPFVFWLVDGTHRMRNCNVSTFVLLDALVPLYIPSIVMI